MGFPLNTELDMKPQNVNRQTYSVAQAARMLGIGVASAYTAAKNGEIPALRIGNRWVVPKAQLDALLADTRHRKAAASN